MWCSGRRVLQELLVAHASRTVVVERWWQVPLSKVGSPPRLYPRRHRVYRLVEDTKHAPKEKMELILTQTVPKLGGRGDTVFVRKSVGRNKLLAEGLAVYPSPENKKLFAEELFCTRGDQRTEPRPTVEFLKRCKLNIRQMPSEDFQLTKAVVCRQFLKQLGVVVPPGALTLPLEPIKELGDYWCDVTVNGLDTARVPMALLPYEDPSAASRRELKRSFHTFTVHFCTSR
uniref:Large ribosomal subunit protein bL9m n=1 Tax=Oryzias latipes TaxID=8090 RepID=A0A3P9HMB3_ORYLA